MSVDSAAGSEPCTSSGRAHVTRCAEGQLKVNASKPRQGESAQGPGLLASPTVMPKPLRSTPTTAPLTLHVTPCQGGDTQGSVPLVQPLTPGGQDAEPACGALRTNGR